MYILFGQEQWPAYLWPRSMLAGTQSVKFDIFDSGGPLPLYHDCTACWEIFICLSTPWCKRFY